MDEDPLRRHPFESNRLRPDQSDACPVGVIVNFPVGGKKGVDVFGGKKVGSAMRSSRELQAPIDRNSSERVRVAEFAGRAASFGRSGGRFGCFSEGAGHRRRAGHDLRALRIVPGRKSTYFPDTQERRGRPSLESRLGRRFR